MIALRRRALRVGCIGRSTGAEDSSSTTAPPLPRGASSTGGQLVTIGALALIIGAAWMHGHGKGHGRGRALGAAEAGRWQDRL